MNKQAIRNTIISHIRKQVRKNGKTLNWPGAPLSHFDVTGDEIIVLREMIADGSVVVVERPKANPAYTATFVCLP